MKNQILLLKRAYKNFGDYLIYDRARKLFDHIAPGAPIIEADAGGDLSGYLNGSMAIKSIVIAGGPGYQPNANPDPYPWANLVMKRNIPVYILGGGIKDSPMIRRPYRFTSDTQRLFHYVNSFGGIGCRDFHTVERLRKKGLAALMNGCRSGTT